MSSSVEWQIAASFSDTTSAEAVAQLLRLEGVETRVVTDRALLGEARPSQIWVPAALSHRARWILSQSQVSEAELDFLATGQFRDDDAVR
jgi:hypothetical protein